MTTLTLSAKEELELQQFNLDMEEAEQDRIAFEQMESEVGLEKLWDTF